MPNVSLIFRDLHRRFGRLPVLRGVSGQVESQQILLVTGTNGSGKSTLLKCLAGLLTADRGTIEYRDAASDGDPLDAALRRRSVGYLAPDLALYEELTVAENLRFFARLRHCDADAAIGLARRLGLPPGRATGALSSGMRQRLRMCWATLHEPSLLLLDEPFQNLDAPGTDAFWQLLEAHLEAGGGMVLASPTTLRLPAVLESHVHQHLDLA